MPSSARRYLLVGLVVLTGVFLYGTFLGFDAAFKCCADAFTANRLPVRKAETSGLPPTWALEPSIRLTDWTAPLRSPASFQAALSGDALGATRYWLTIHDDSGRVRREFVTAKPGGLWFGGYCGAHVGPREKLTLKIIPVSAMGVHGEERTLEFTTPRMSALQHLADLAYTLPSSVAKLVWGFGLERQE